VTPEELLNLEKRLIQVNSIAPRINTTFSEVPLDKILNVNAFTMQKALQVDPQFTVPTHIHIGDDCDHESHKNRHSNDIHTVFFQVEGSTTRENINQWAAGLLWDKELDCEILRIKGVISIKENPQRFMMQGVVDNFDIQPSGFEWDTEPRINKFVFIGKRLDEHCLKKYFVTKCNPTVE